MIVKPFRSEATVTALRHLEVSQIVVYECRGYGRQKGHVELYTGPEYSISFLPKVCIEFVCSRFALKEVLDTLLPIARTGRIGDGKVFITSLSAPPSPAES
jgi:nitrogen regulatory protein P-II 1